MKNKISEMKIKLDGIASRVDTTEKISLLDNIVIYTTQFYFKFYFKCTTGIKNRLKNNSSVHFGVASSSQNICIISLKRRKKK